MTALLFVVKVSQMTKKKILTIVISLIAAAFLIWGITAFLNSETHAGEIEKSEAEIILNEGFDSMANTAPLKFIAEKNSIEVNDISYGEERNIILDCTVKTIDVHSALSKEYNSFMSANAKKGNGTMYKSALDFKLEFEEKMVGIISGGEEISVSARIFIYDTKDGLEIYASDDAVNTVFGGIVDVSKEVSALEGYKDASGGLHKFESGNIVKGFNQCLEPKRNSKKPDTSTALGKMWKGLKDDFHKNFIVADRWKTIVSGLWVTLKLTFCALIIGIILGFLVAFVRCTYLKTSKHGILLKLFNKLCEIYLTITRGTPVVVQIMIIYFVIFMPMGVDKFIAAVICFGLNSGAYVAEIVRGGIMSIDAGQTEAGRSLGFSYMQTMWNIVFPQAFKAVLPSLANEFVVLLKETSIAFYIGLGDLMYSGNAIRAATYSAFMPLVAVAVIYLIMVMVLSKLVSILERRLRNSER